MSAIYQDLKDKNILITGANRGIGYAIACELARQKSHLFFSTRHEGEATQRLVSEFKELGAASASPLCFDLTDHDQVKEQCQKAFKELDGGLDGLVNNAGISIDQLLMRLKPATIDRVISTNLSSTIYLTGVCARYLMRANSASIVNISSIVGLMGNPGQSVYAASKAGLIGFSKSIAKELASRHIRSNIICPGFIASDMTDQLNEQTREKYLEAIALGHFGKAQDIAYLTSFLLSQNSRYITGESFKVDGGLYI